MPKRAADHLSPPATPRQEGRGRLQHYPTPTKAILQGVASFCDAQNLPYSKSDLFRHFNVKERTGWAILANEYPRRRANNPFKPDKSGRPSKLTNNDLLKMDRILQDYGFDGRSLTWEQLAEEAGLEDVSGRTVRRHMGTMGYRKCLACRKGWVSQQNAKRRVKWARDALDSRPFKEHWRDVRFSDEMHAGYNSEHTINIIRRPGERYCQDCIQHAPEPDEADRKRQHCWAAAGWNFKSDIHFYEVPGNKNGKMSQHVYRDEILEKAVKPWLDANQSFVLEEDGDSGHGPSKKNIVRTWKENHGLKFYFNCPFSPDLAPIENCWQASKQELKKCPRWDDQDIRDGVVEGWKGLSFKSINKWCDSMPERLRNVIDGDGQLTGY